MPRRPLDLHDPCNPLQLKIITTMVVNPIHGGAIHCLFCGGKECKYEKHTHEAWRGQRFAIDGLHSQWITPDILAMQRPSTRLLDEYSLVEKFRLNRLGAVFNLQQQGEHASCGDGIEPASGFSYLPESFMDNGIYYVTHASRAG